MTVEINVVEVAVEVAGWVGATLILLSYGLLTTHRLVSTSPIYQWMNVIGAIGFAINGAWNHAYPSMTLNIIWLVLAVYGLTRGRRSR
jgi:hypothetical protein